MTGSLAAVLVGTAPRADARPSDRAPLTTPAVSLEIPRSAEARLELPLRSGPTVRADTIDFGFYEIRPDGKAYAVSGERWTFDHGASDPREGWISNDLTENDRDFWRRIDAATWTAEGNSPPWPQIDGTGLALCGAGENLADSLNWAAGTGYGNGWCQRLTSPPLTYDGSGSIQLSLLYFNETETEFDYSKIYLDVDGLRVPLNAAGFSGKIGVGSTGTLTPREWSRTVTNAELGGGSQPRTMRLVLEVVSDGGGSDEDGAYGWDAFYGGFGVDDVVFEGANLIPPAPVAYGFETDLEGWSVGHCPGVGSHFGIAPLSQYSLPDPCACGMAGDVMEFHDGALGHPDSQYEIAISPIFDRTDLGPGYLEQNWIAAEMQIATEGADLGMAYRILWSYFPYEDPEHPGVVRWSPPLGSANYFIAEAGCASIRSVATGPDGVPADAQMVRLILEVRNLCSGFGLPDCPVDEPGPIFDNVRIRVSRQPAAPTIQFALGGRFQDGFNPDQSGAPDWIGAPGNADIAYNVRLGNGGAPCRLGDSLSINGPSPSSASRWEARLWWRLPHLGPAQSSNPVFTTWKNAVLAAKGIDFFTGPSPQFTWGYLDSCEAGTQASKLKFCSQFRDGPSSGGGNLPADPNFNWGGGGEQGEGNEILPDLCFTPGTKIEYFVTANYTCTPNERFYLPDTTGGCFEEFEQLPGWRLAGGVSKYPCILYVDASHYRNSGPSPSGALLDHAWNTILNGAEPLDPLPNPPNWDRYDYLETGTTWGPPFFRDFGGSNGATAASLMGYRAILVHTGNRTDALRERDCLGLTLWLDSALGCGNLTGQALIVDGNHVADDLAQVAPWFLRDYLGGALVCSAYHDPDCPLLDPDNDTNPCVRLESSVGNPIPSGVSFDLFGNDCPISAEFAVLGTAGVGVGTRVYEKIDTGTETSYAQVIRDQLGSASHYRTVLNGWSYDFLTTRDLSGPPDPGGECPDDPVSRISAVASELGNSLRWALNLSNPPSLGLCVFPSDCFSGAPDGAGDVSAAVTRLEPNRPNPFNPRTAIRFALASAGEAKLVIYDVQGREIRRLIDGPQAAGAHEVVWDGRAEDGRVLPAGIYWSRLWTDGYRSNRKMLLLR